MIDRDKIFLRGHYGGGSWGLNCQNPISGESRFYFQWIHIIRECVGFCQLNKLFPVWSLVHVLCVHTQHVVTCFDSDFFRLKLMTVKSKRHLPVPGWVGNERLWYLRKKNTKKTCLKVCSVTTQLYHKCRSNRPWIVQTVLMIKHIIVR